ncbi:CaiB/BaiF CoA transferase family protein [Streptomyces krungchingensis]|uniref:CaiB/BaiF CoA transferase family protein n=1 Tax=Streptomyces krungchingensis TaxID=1565034 RepID=UPI003CF67997
MSGPLEGIRVLELAGMGPGPHAGMQLADMGADVVRVVRPTAAVHEREGNAYVQRGRTIVVADLKDERARGGLTDLVRHADVLIEGFRPGVAERLGLGPQECRAMNPRLVYARVTGWGQDGPLSGRGGHDINYIALTGALHAIGTADEPVPPLSLVGNYGGGAMFVVTGVLAALLQRSRTGQGDVVDISTVDGTCTLLQPILELRGQGLWSDRRQDNLLDGGRPYYRTYACSDGRHMAVGAIEPQFYANLVAGLGLDGVDLPAQDDPDGRPVVEKAFADAFGRHPRGHWEQVFRDLDACVTPVLSFDEAVTHPHIEARGTLVDGPEGLVAAGAPRFSSAAGTIAPTPPVSRTATLAEAVETWRS